MRVASVGRSLPGWALTPSCHSAPFYHGVRLSWPWRADAWVWVGRSCDLRRRNAVFCRGYDERTTGPGTTTSARRACILLSMWRHHCESRA